MFILEMTTTPMHVLRLNQEETSLGIRIVKETPKQTFSSYEDMELFCVNLLLDKSMESENRYLLNHSKPQGDYVLGHTLDPFIINIAGNIVARNTRRGAANLLLHSITYDEILNRNLITAKLQESFVLPNVTLQYVESVPPDTVILVYSRNNAVGTVNLLDGPFSYIRDDRGYHLFWDDESHRYASILPI